MNEIWKIWKYSLGSFSDAKTKKYDDIVLVVRSIIFLTYLTTNCFIVAGVIRHWGDSSKTVPISMHHNPRPVIL